MPFVLLLTNCDPGMGGDLKIFNDTDKTLTVKYCEYKVSNASSCDTITTDIQSQTSITVDIFQKHGKAKKFDCCPCETNICTITSIYGLVKKDPNNQDNWNIPNKNKLKNNGKTDIKCEFHVLQTDL